MHISPPDSQHNKAILEVFEQHLEVECSQSLSNTPIVTDKDLRLQSTDLGPAFGVSHLSAHSTYTTFLQYMATHMIHQCGIMAVLFMLACVLSFNSSDVRCVFLG